MRMLLRENGFDKFIIPKILPIPDIPVELAISLVLKKSRGTQNTTKVIIIPHITFFIVSLKFMVIVLRKVSF